MKKSSKREVPIKEFLEMRNDHPSDVSSLLVECPKCARHTYYLIEEKCIECEYAGSLVDFIIEYEING